MHVEHRSDDEPGGDLTGKFAQNSREREGHNGNLCFAKAMITFLIFLLEVMIFHLIVFSRSNFFNCVAQVTDSSNLSVTSAAKQHQPCPAYDVQNRNKNKILSSIYWFSYLGLSEFLSSL